jgi:Tfp pilus assembly protein PilN
MSDRRTEDRRAEENRRQAAERRRPSENRYAAFELCRSTLHLALVVFGDGSEPDRLVTRSIRWRNEATSLDSEDGARELTAAFRKLVAEERLTGLTARIVLNGEFCVTRVVTGSSEKVQRELGELEERSGQYLMLGPGKKVSAQSSEQLDARHEHALLSVTNQSTLQLLMNIASSTGIKLDVIEPSLVALGRAQEQLSGGHKEACLIIQLDEGEAELGICHQGCLLLDYRPGGHADATHIAEVVAEHMERVKRFLSRQHSYLQQGLRHVYLTGSPEVVRQASAGFAALKQFQVHVLDPGQLEAKWQCAGDSPDTEYAAVLGAVLAKYDASCERRSPNLLENVLTASRQPIGPMMIRSAIPLAAVLLMALTLLILWGRERMTTAELRAELKGFAPARQRADELKFQLLRTDAKLTQMKALESKLPKQDWGTLLQHIAQSMPDDVWLDRITLRDSHTAQLSGASYTDGGVYDFVNYLKQVPQVAQIDLEGTGVGHTPTGPTTNFDLELSLAQSPSEKQ